MLNKLNTFFKHPVFETLGNLVLKFRRSKSYWSVSSLVLIFTLREAIAWSIGEKIKGFCQIRLNSESITSYESFFWNAVEVLFVGGNVELVILGMVLFFILSIVKISESSNKNILGNNQTNLAQVIALLIIIGILSYQTVVYFKTDNKLDKIINTLTEEFAIKNKEIVNLKAKLEKSTSEEERIKLSSKINLLKKEIDEKTEQNIKLKKRLEEYSQDIEIVKHTNDLYKEKGADEALKYLESIDFDRVLTQSIEHAKALIIKADLYAIKNQHKKAEETYLKSIQLNRNYDNVISYVAYLFDQNNYNKMIKQLSLLKLESNQLTQNQNAMLAGNLAYAYQGNNRLKDAEKEYIVTLGIYRALSKESPNAYLPYIATTLNNLAILYSFDNHLKDAEKAYDKALGISRALSKQNPSEYLSYVATTLHNLANLYSSDNRLKDAEKAYNEALGIRRALSKENPSEYLSSVASTLNNLAILYSSDNRQMDAEKAYDEALGVYRALSKENPSAHLSDVATTLHSLAVLYSSDIGLMMNAEKAYDEALGIRRALSKENPSAYMPDVATTLNSLAILYSSDNRLKESEQAYDEALLIYRALSKENLNAYGIYLAKIIIMGVVKVKKPKENLAEAKEILLKFKGVYEAEQLIRFIDQLEIKK